jgi:hypothetical protein
MPCSLRKFEQSSVTLSTISTRRSTRDSVPSGQALDLQVHRQGCTRALCRSLRSTVITNNVEDPPPPAVIDPAAPPVPAEQAARPPPPLALK